MSFTLPGTRKFQAELASLLNKKVTIRTDHGKVYKGTLIGYDANTLHICLSDVEDQEGNVKIMFMEPGIELRITPVVRTDGTIELTVYTKVSKSQSYPNVTVMGESTREAQTSVIVKNGSTLVIGGLIRETKEVKETKIPFLGDLPFLGQFFRTKEDDVDKRNLLIFITARVIEP